MKHKGSKKGRGEDIIVKGDLSLAAVHQHRGQAMLEEARHSRRDFLKVRLVESLTCMMYGDIS